MLIWIFREQGMRSTQVALSRRGFLLLPCKGCDQPWEGVESEAILGNGSSPPVAEGALSRLFPFGHSCSNLFSLWLRPFASYGFCSLTASTHHRPGILSAFTLRVHCLLSRVPLVLNARIIYLSKFIFFPRRVLGQPMPF